MEADPAPEPGPWRAKCGGVAEGRNEEEDGKAVAGSAGSARTFLVMDHGRDIRAAEKAALSAALVARDD